MRKLKKLLRNPRAFFADAYSKRFNRSANTDSVTSVKQRKSQQKYLEELTTFTSSFNVNLLKLGDEYIWPYLRNHIWNQLYFLGLGKNTSEVIPHRLQLGTSDNLPFNLRAYYKEKYSAFEIDELPTDEVDFLFVTIINASEQVELDNGEIYYRITDPLYEEAMKLGKARKIEFIKVISPALENVKRYKHRPYLILPPSLYKSGYSQKVSFHYKFFETVKRLIPSLNLTPFKIEQIIDWEMHTREYYIDTLKRLKPKVIFFNGFHYHAPFISAAHCLGIKSVDVQHGIQVGWNPLYNNWSELPVSEKYQALPDYFFVWGKKEYDSILSVFGNQGFYKPIIFGNPWLFKQIEYSEPIKEKYLSKFRQYKMRVMLVLQASLEVPSLLQEIVQSSPSNILWIIRHHPKGARFKVTDFSKEGAENVLLSPFVDNVSLSRLFEYVDITVSAGSTVALEADYFGVKNFICTIEGYNNYKVEIEEGKFFFFDDKESFYQSVEQLDLDDRTSRVDSFAKVDLSTAMRSILGG